MALIRATIVRRAALCLSCALTSSVFGIGAAHAQNVMQYGGVPSLGGYGGYGGYGGGYGGGFGAGITPQQPWMPYGAPQPPANTPANQSAANPVTTFGLPKPKDPNETQRTVFAPPPTYYRNESKPTTDHDESGYEGSDGFGESQAGAYSKSFAAGSYNEKDLENPSSQFFGGNENDIDAGRNSYLTNAARSLGRRGGFASEAQRLNKYAPEYAADMDRRFNFDRLRNGYVMPPVISAVDTTSESCGVNCLYLTTGAFRVAQEAYVTDRSPSWRDYLFLDAPKIQLPSGLKIKSRDRDLWKRNVQEGWTQGIQKARNDFLERMARLDRDYAGMVRYYELEQQGAISLSRVAIENRHGAIYVNGKAASQNEMRVGLTVTPQFQNRGAIANAHVSSMDAPR